MLGIDLPEQDTPLWYSVVASRSVQYGTPLGYPSVKKEIEMSVLTPPEAGRRNRRWLGLAVIAAAQFMVIMDTSIIGVALPEMQRDLGFTQIGRAHV